MSVGISVLNKSGIAIAADSATTMGERLAIYNSAEKVFHVSEKHPIVILKYGTVLFMNIPNEIIIKQFGQYLNQFEPFSKFHDYCDAFIKFIETASPMFNFKHSEEDLIDRELFNMIRDISWYFNNRNQNIDNHQKRLEESFKNFTEAHEFGTQTPNYDVTDYLQLHYQTFIKNYLKEIKFDNILLTNYQIDTFYQYFLHYHHVLTNVICGLAFNGYGKDDLYPSTTTLELFGVMNHKLKYSIVKEAHISDKYPRAIKTFAQDLAIHTYLDGIDPEVNYDIQQLYQNFVNEKIETLPKIFNDKQKKILIDHIFDSKATEYLYDQVYEITRVNWGKTYGAVEILPEEELVKFAEFLVDLCSFKSKYSLDKQLNMTVGGPADVVLITKSDGVLWYKKKNQEFFRVKT